MKRHLISIAILLTTTALQGQTPPRKAADDAFKEGKALMVETKYPEACRKFEESQLLDASSGTALWLGDCYEKSGRFGSAWEAYTVAIELAEKQNKTDRKEAAEKRAKALLPRVSFVTLKVTHPQDDQEIRLNSRVIKRTLWAREFAVDPGAYVLAAVAPGRTAVEKSFKVIEEGARLTIDVPELERVLAPRPPEPPPTASSASAAPAPPPPRPAISAQSPPVPAASHVESSPAPPPAPPAKSSSVGPYALAGVGGLVLVGGALLQVSAHSKAKEANDERNHSLYDEASGRQTLALIGMGLGGALVAGGLVWLVSGSSSSTSATAYVTPVMGSRMAGLGFGGSW